MRRVLRLIAVALVGAACSTASAEEWPKWMGLDGTGIVNGATLLPTWPRTGPKKLWSAKVGEGFSSPIALDGKVYLFSQEGRNDVLAAYEADTGKVAWKQSDVATRKPDADQGANSQNGLAPPQATPTIDSGRIYTYAGGGELTCRQLQDGKQLWRTDVLEQTGTTILNWGQASSPLVDEQYIYVQAGKDGPTAAAFDKGTGKLAWKSASALASYAAPILITVGKSRQLIIFGGEFLFSLDPKTGKEIWRQPWKTDYDINAATPVYHDGHLFISSGYTHGCAMYTVTENGAKKDWENTEIQCKYPSPILDGDRLYANSEGTLKCVHWPDGKLIWSTRSDPKLGPGGSIVLVGKDKMITLTERGRLSLVDIRPTRATVLSEVALFDYDKVWSMPLVYHGHVYAKGKDEMVCLEVGK